MKARRNMKKGLIKNNKGCYFVAVAICCMLVCTSGMAAVTGVSKSENNAVSKNTVNEKVVSPHDIGLVKYHYGCDPSVSEFEQYDINMDGVINPEDVVYLEKHGLREPLQVTQVDNSVQHMDSDFLTADEDNIDGSHQDLADINEIIDTGDISTNDPIDVQSEEMLEQYQTSSLFFTENRGQFPDEVLFQTQVSGATVYLCRDKVVSVFTRNVDDESSMGNDIRGQMYEVVDESMELPERESLSVWASFEGVNQDVQLVGKGALPHYNNYFYGNIPENWVTNVPNFKEVVYQDVYDGVDLRYYFSEGNLKYDFIVEPDVDPSQIVVRYDGVDNLKLTDSGDLSIETDFGNLAEQTPVIYQDDSTGRTFVDGGYRLLDDGCFVFTIDASYDTSLPLVIDPILAYSTYLGGSGGEYSDYPYSEYGIAVDAEGCAYVTGSTYSSDFPTTPGAFDTTYNGGDVFVTKLWPAGNELVYSTYIGANEIDFGADIILDAEGCAYITGYTESVDFPTTSGAYNQTLNGYRDVFVTKLAPAGDVLIYSTFLGGTSGDLGRDIVVDDMECAYVIGYTSSSDFPTTPGAYDSTFNSGNDVFVTKLSTEGDALIYSTFIGGSGQDYGFNIDLDDVGYAYLTGYTKSSNFPTTPGTYDTTYNGEEDVFATKLSPEGDALVYSTYLGGIDDDFCWGSYGIKVDEQGFVYVTGTTCSVNFPTTPGAYDMTYNGYGNDVFVTKFTPAGDALVFSTFLGGTGYDFGFDLVIDDQGFATVTGSTNSYDFPTTPGAYDHTLNDYLDVFVTKLSHTGDALIYSTYLGGDHYDEAYGMTIDAEESIYITGYTMSDNYPVTPDAYDMTYNGGYADVFVTKLAFHSIDIDLRSILSPADNNRPGLIPINITLLNHGESEQVVPVGCSIYEGTIAETHLFEDFEGAVFPPEGWSIVQYSGDGTWEQEAYATGDYYDPPNPTDSLYYAEADCYEHQYDHDVGLFTPPLNFSDANLTMLFFDRNFHNYNGDGFAKINVYSGGNSLSNFEEQLLFMDEHDSTYGVHTTLAFNPSLYTDPSEVYIEFYFYFSGYSYGGKFCIDNVNVSTAMISGDLMYLSETMASISGGSEIDFELIPLWNATVGEYIIYVNTQLPDDENPANDQKSKFFTVKNFVDVGISQINNPATSPILPGMVTVNATVNNYGDTDELIPVNCSVKQGSQVIYSSQIMVPLDHLSAVDVEFSPPWEALPGSYTVYVRTLLPGDEKASNNEKHRYVSVIAEVDAGVISIDYPTGFQHPGDYIVEATIENSGSLDQTIPVNCSIFNEYDDLVYSCDASIFLTSFTSSSVEFTPAWHVDVFGEYRINVSTMLTGDEDPRNDAQEITVVIQPFTDVGVSSINYPSGIIQPGLILVNATVENYGEVDQDVPVNCSIYEDDVLIYSAEEMVFVDHFSTVDFEFSPPWDATPGDYTVIVTTLLPGDENPDNDELSEFVSVISGVDAGVVSIDYPTGSMPPGNYVVEAKIRNYGSLNQTIPVHCSIYNETDSEVYSCDTAVFVPYLTTTYVEFTPAWHVDIAGMYRIVVSTELLGDTFPDNDIQEVTVFIQPDVVYVDDDFDPSTPGWGVDHFDSIQDGVDAVTYGGQVLVSSGVYSGTVYIHKSLSLLGEDEESTIIQSTASSLCSISISDWYGIGWVTVSNFTIQSSSEFGIILENAHYCTISNCTVHVSGSAIELKGSSHNLIRDCSISDCIRAIGIRNGNSEMGTRYSSYNTIINNWIHDNTFGIFIIVIFASGINVENVIQNNLIESNNEEGILLYDANYNEISYNILLNNSNLAVGLYYDVYGNVVHHNNLINSGGEDCCSDNDWFAERDGFLEGNYWWDYWMWEIEDADGDRIGDDPHPIRDDSGYYTNEDPYPLMFPWGELPPVAQQFTYTIMDGLTVQFDASDSFDRDGDIVTYSWNFDDGTTLEVENPVVEHSFPESGYYNVTLTVIDNDDYSESIYENILIDNPPPTPYKPTGCTFGFIDETYFYFTPEVVDPDGDTVEYLFDWGDSTTSGWIPDRIANHSWSEKGIYEVRVKARDQYLLESSWSEPLMATIHEDLCPCDVNFDGMVDPVDVGLVKYYYGQDPSLPEYSVYDVNLDGSIDPQDVGLIKYHYGPCPTC